MTAHTALPARYVDLIHDGVPRSVVLSRGAHGVFGALLSTANSAVQHGWSFSEWSSLLLKPDQGLGRQVRVDRDGRIRAESAVRKELRKAWEKALKWSADNPNLTAAAIKAEIEAVAEWLAAVELPEPERLVMAHAVGSARTHQSITPVMPRREVMAGTGLTERAVRATLAALDGSGLLTCRSRGFGGPVHRRAAVYRLPDEWTRTLLLPHRSPQEQVYGATHDRAPPGDLWGSDTPLSPNHRGGHLLSPRGRLTG